MLDSATRQGVPSAGKNDPRPLYDDFTPTHPTLARLRETVNEITLELYSRETWEQRNSMMRQLITFCNKWDLPLNLDSIPLFLESKGNLKSSSKIQYAQTLRHMLTKNISILDAYLTAMRKRSAREPVKQAEPIPPEVVEELIEKFSWEDGTVLRLAWMTASRWAEVYNLRTDNLLLEKDGSVILDWAAIPKTAKINPFTANRYLRFTGEEASLLTRLKHHRGPGARLTDMTTAAIASRLRPLGFTAHSIKRGALQTAAELTEIHGLNPRDVSALAKHTDPHSIVNTTSRYMNKKVVHLTTTHHLSRLLSSLISPPSMAQRPLVER
eukprot:gene9972-biopygen7075